VRAKRKTPTPKDDLSWNEVGEMAYGYLRIPFALIFVELIYWWATDTTNSFEPYQAGVAVLWESIGNLIWPNSFDLVWHDTSALTQINMHNKLFPGGEVSVFVSDECVGMHEIVFLGVLMMLTPGVSNKIRIRSIAGMVIIVQALNFIRLMVLYPLAVSGCEGDMANMKGCEAPMHEFHEFILSSGFLAVLVFIWLGWYYVLMRKGLVDRSKQPSLADLEQFKHLRLREKLPNTSKFAIVFSLLLATWGTWSYAIDDENLEWKASAKNCEWNDNLGWIDSDGNDCTNSKEKWEEVEGRSVRSWVFGAIFIALSVFTTEPLLATTANEEE